MLGVDLVEVIDGGFSAARALWLLEQLGEGSAIGAAVAGGPAHRPWTLSAVLASETLNALRAANWQRSGGRGKRPTAVAPPKRDKVAGRAVRREGARGQQAAARIARKIGERRKNPTPT